MFCRPCVETAPQVNEKCHITKKRQESERRPAAPAGTTMPARQTVPEQHHDDRLDRLTGPGAGVDPLENVQNAAEGDHSDNKYLAQRAAGGLTHIVEITTNPTRPVQAPASAPRARPPGRRRGGKRGDPEPRRAGRRPVCAAIMPYGSWA